jgi:hypothetical protein
MRVAFATSLYCLAFLTTLYRIFVRIRIQRWGWDDTCAMIAVLSALGLFMMLWVSVYEGIYYPHKAQLRYLVIDISS